MFCEKVVLRNFTKFAGKHLCQSLFFNKIASLGLQLYQKRDSGTGVFLPINFVKFLRTSFLQNTPGRLCLYCEWQKNDLTITKLRHRYFSCKFLRLTFGKQYLEKGESKHNLHQSFLKSIREAFYSYPGWETLHLWFSSYWYIKFAGLLESQKSSSSIFPVLKRLIIFSGIFTYFYEGKIPKIKKLNQCIKSD